MRILLTNDDGIRAPGIIALHRALNGELGADPLGDLTTVAPLTVQSATSHGVTFHQPLMTQHVRVNGAPGIAVDGRPADCVKLALTNLWPELFGEGSRPDLAVSGINAGANVGINVLYSGTVAAAIEAAFLGVPSIAVSLHIDRAEADFDLAASHARRAIDAVLGAGLLGPHGVVNINIPAAEYLRETSPALRVCPMNTHALVDRYEPRTNPGGERYYWAAGHGLDFRVTDDGTDVHRLFERSITITPLRFDLTEHARLDAWKAKLEA